MAKNNRIGAWAFLIGIVLAVVIGIFQPAGDTFVIALVIIGIIVGLLNIAGKEVQPFLMSGAVLIIATGLGQNVLSSVKYVGPIVNALLILFVPATIIVAIKHVFQLARR